MPMSETMIDLEIEKQRYQWYNAILNYLNGKITMDEAFVLIEDTRYKNEAFKKTVSKLEEKDSCIWADFFEECSDDFLNVDSSHYLWLRAVRTARKMGVEIAFIYKPNYRPRFLDKLLRTLHMDRNSKSSRNERPKHTYFKLPVFEEI